MLVGGCMEHDRRMVGFKYFVQTRFVTDGTNQGDDGGIGTVLVFQLGFQLIGTVLVDIKISSRWGW